MSSTSILVSSRPSVSRRDFVPCVDGNGKAGLYDGVTERIFYLGENKVFDPTNCVGAVTNWLSLADRTLPDAKISYIESDDASDYFDVGVMAKDGVEMEAVCAGCRH